ncbi:MAG: hypothetical protein M1449_02130, partial [Candidatus Thermoplasmatota archaeon]|nr:hypothetical protein [Candidatus Thermoplasmatota archaeon]
MRLTWWYLPSASVSRSVCSSSLSHARAAIGVGLQAAHAHGLVTHAATRHSFRLPARVRVRAMRLPSTSTLGA